jgi:hypothetical protein
MPSGWGYDQAIGLGVETMEKQLIDIAGPALPAAAQRLRPAASDNLLLRRRHRGADHPARYLPEAAAVAALTGAVP